MNRTNIFGGKNPHGLYVPMSETEQEVLARLVESKDLEVYVYGWDITVPQPKISFGDHRITIMFRLPFYGKAPIGTKLYEVDLELRSQDGRIFSRRILPTIYGGKPVEVGPDVHLDVAWDITIHSINPAVVKAIKPGAMGLTSRRQDKDTKEMTIEGNMKLDGKQRGALRRLEDGYKKVAESDAKDLAKAANMKMAAKKTPTR